MVRPSRRRFLVGSSLVALTGCLGDTGDRSTLSETPESTPTDTDTTTPEQTVTPDGDSQQEIPSSFREALAPVPESIGEDSLTTVRVFQPTETETRAGTVGLLATSNVGEALGLDTEDIGHVGYAVYGQGNIVIAVVGDFAADDPSPPEDSDPIALHREDGLFLGAANSTTSSSGSREWDAGIEAATATKDDDGAGILTDDSVVELLRPVAQRQTVVAYPSYPPGEGLFAGQQPDIDGLDAAAIGVDFLEERTIEFAAVGQFDSESAVDAEKVNTIVTDAFGIDASGTATERDGRSLVATGRYQYPAQPSYEASPDADLSVRYTGSGTATIEHRGGDTVDTDTLTLFVDGEAREGVWTTDTLQAGTTVEFDAQPFTAYQIKWVDPEDEDTFDYLERGVVVPEQAFETSYDADSDTVTFTYTGDTTVSTANLVVETDPGRAPGQRGSRGTTRPEPPESEETPLSEWTDSLEPEESFTVEDVGYYDTVVLMAEIEFENAASGRSVAYHTPRPPGYFSFEHDGGRAVVYHGEQSRPASDYRVTVGGDSTATQFADEYDTLTGGDSVPVDGEPGEMVRVEWVGGDQPVVMLARRLSPPVSFDLLRDGEAFDLTYTADTEWAASEFEVQTEGEAAATQFADSYETLTSGDAIELPASVPRVEVLWTGNGEPMSVYSETVQFDVEFEMAYSDGSAELTFDSEGEWPASEFQVELDGESVTSFAEQYDTITAGDSITVEGSMGQRLTVLWDRGERASNVYSETLAPSLSFELSHDAEASELTLTSQTPTAIDPAKLRVELLGEGHETRPDAWSDAHDTVEEGDQLTVSVPDGIQAVAIVHEEWDTHELIELGEDSENSN